MRNLNRIILIIAFLFAGAASAQTVKFGHIDFQQIVSAMPEQDAAQKALQKLQSDLESQFGTMQKELQDKSKDYLAQQQKLTDAVRATKEDEINGLNQRIQNFQQQAQQNMQQEQAKQIQPIIEKAKKAIADVARAQGLVYVFDVNSVYYHSEQSVDLSAPVKAKLGIK